MALGAEPEIITPWMGVLIVEALIPLDALTAEAAIPLDVLTPEADAVITGKSDVAAMACAVFSGFERNHLLSFCSPVRNTSSLSGSSRYV